jgi:hypothetical protein
MDSTFGLRIRGIQGCGLGVGGSGLGLGLTHTLTASMENGMTREKPKTLRTNLRTCLESVYIILCRPNLSSV